LFEKQFLPTQKDIENKDIKNLAQRLKEKTYEESLTNIVEWQEKNILYWADRAYMFILLYFLLFMAIFSLPVSNPIKSVLSCIFLLFALIDFAFLLSFVLLLVASIIGLFIWLSSLGFLITNKILPIIILSMLFGGVISLLSYLILKYRSIKSSQPDFKLWDAFQLSLSVDKILKYRLAICRDYAKLTASLLLNVYPEHELYFITIPRHVAVAIKIDKKFYVLDQRLPVTSLEKWLFYWKERFKKKRIKANIFRIYNQEGIKIKKEASKILSSIKIPKVDTKSLENKLSDILNVKQVSLENKADLKIPLKNCALFYDRSEIVEFSLIRAIMNVLRKEFCGSIHNKISKLEVSQDKKDLILNVYLAKSSS